MTDFGVIVSSITAACELAKTIKTFTNVSEAKESIAKLLDILISAQSQTSVLLEENNSLKQKIADLENQIVQEKKWRAKTHQYNLHKFKSGSVAMTQNKFHPGRNPVHYLCANCMEENVVAYLHRQQTFNALECNRCKEVIPLTDEDADELFG